MFFAYVCLRPTLAGIDAKTRTTLWAQVLHRFFGYVFLSAALLLGAAAALGEETDEQLAEYERIACIDALKPVLFEGPDRRYALMPVRTP